METVTRHRSCFFPFFISSFPSSSYDRWPHLTLPPFSPPPPPPHTWVKKRLAKINGRKAFLALSKYCSTSSTSTVPVSTTHLVIKEKSVSSAKTFFSVWGREMQCRGKLYLYRMLCTQRTHANAVLCLYLYPSSAEVVGQHLCVQPPLFPPQKKSFSLFPHELHYCVYCDGSLKWLCATQKS